MFVLCRTTRVNTRRTEDVETSKCLRVGTQHKKLGTRPRLTNRAWTINEEVCKGGRRCQKQGSNQPLQTKHHSCVVTYNISRPTSHEMTTIVPFGNNNRRRKLVSGQAPHERENKWIMVIQVNSVNTRPLKHYVTLPRSCPSTNDPKWPGAGWWSVETPPP